MGLFFGLTFPKQFDRKLEEILSLLSDGSSGTIAKEADIFAKKQVHFLSWFLIIKRVYHKSEFKI